jgi:hypothetical protein
MLQTCVLSGKSRTILGIISLVLAGGCEPPKDAAGGGGGAPAAARIIAGSSLSSASAGMTRVPWCAPGDVHAFSASATRSSRIVCTVVRSLSGALLR